MQHLDGLEEAQLAHEFEAGTHFLRIGDGGVSSETCLMALKLPYPKTSVDSVLKHSLSITNAMFG